MRYAAVKNLVMTTGLPALYSPDLNPIEQAWKLTRHLAMHNRYFPRLDGVVQAAETQFA